MVDNPSTVFGKWSINAENLRRSSTAGRLADNSETFGGMPKSKWYKKGGRLDDFS
jgi:hypothetical protein